MLTCVEMQVRGTCKHSDAHVSKKVKVRDIETIKVIYLMFVV